MLRTALFVAFAIAWQVPTVCAQENWEQDVRKRIAKNEKHKALAAKYPLVLLHSRNLYPDGLHWAFSFVDEVIDPEKEVQLMFLGGVHSSVFELNASSGQQNLVVDLGEADFEKIPDPKRISIDDKRVMSSDARAIEGHVYLERVRDERGNNFYVVFQVMAVDSNVRYMAFIWRRLPGGKIVKQPEKMRCASDRGECLDSSARAEFGIRAWSCTSSQNDEKPNVRRWEDEVRKRIAKDKTLTTLTARNPLVILCSRRMYDNGPWSFSFIYETSDKQRNWNEVQIQFVSHLPNMLKISSVGQHNLIVDLGKADYEIDPDPTRISIDDTNVVVTMAYALEGHLYLERIRGVDGNNFYVVFLIVAMDPEGRYLAFIWRRLPGGTVVKRPLPK